MVKEELIKQYLEDESKLYKDWYKQITFAEGDSGREPVAWREDAIAITKERFKTWCRQNLPTIQRIVCVQEIQGKTICVRWRELCEVRCEPLERTFTELLTWSEIIAIPFPLSLEVFFLGLFISGCLQQLCNNDATS